MIRVSNNSTPTDIFMNLAEEIAQKLSQHIRVDGNCWIWTGKLIHNRNPYLQGIGLVRAFLMRRVHHTRKRSTSTCGNHLCVNPEHLCPIRKGETHHSAKLTDEKVKTIRNLAHTTPPYILAEKFNVSVTTIINVVTRKTWRHVE